AQGQGDQDVPRGRDLAHGSGVHSSEPPEYDDLSRHGLCGALEPRAPLLAVNVPSAGSYVARSGAARGASRALLPPIRGLRWWICAMLFASTAINYIDRQTLSLLAPYLKLEHGWTNGDYANIVIAFRIAY